MTQQRESGWDNSYFYCCEPNLEHCILFSTMKWQCCPKVNWEWLYAAIQWQYAALPLPVSQTPLPLAGPPANVQNEEVWPILFITCHRNFSILLVFFSPLWNMSLLPLDNFLPFVPCLLFPSVQGTRTTKFQSFLDTRLTKCFVNIFLFNPGEKNPHGQG